MDTKTTETKTETKTETTPEPKKNPCEGCSIKGKCLNGWIYWNGSEYPCDRR